MEEKSPHDHNNCTLIRVNNRNRGTNLIQFELKESAIILVISNSWRNQNSFHGRITVSLRSLKELVRFARQMGDQTRKKDMWAVGTEYFSNGTPEKGRHFLHWISYHSLPFPASPKLGCSVLFVTCTCPQLVSIICHQKNSNLCKRTWHFPPCQFSIIVSLKSREDNSVEHQLLSQ